MTYESELAEIVAASGLDNAMQIAAQITHPSWDLDNFNFFVSTMVDTGASTAADPIRDEIVDTIEEWQNGKRPSLEGMLDRSRWLSVLIWVSRWWWYSGADTALSNRITASPFRQPDPELEPNWPKVLEGLTERDQCPHRSWLLEEADRTAQANSDRFERVAKIRIPGSVETSGEGFRNNFGNYKTWVNCGQYAYDRHKDQIVHDTFDSKGWRPVPQLNSAQIRVVAHREFWATLKVAVAASVAVAAIGMIALIWSESSSLGQMAAQVSVLAAFPIAWIAFRGRRTYLENHAPVWSPRL